jgi:hypothetical protein
VGYTKRTPLKGQRFESLEEAQAHLDRWETNWADTRIHGTTKRQVAALFAEENQLCCRCHWNRSAITGTANGSCIWMVVSKPRITVYRQAGLDVESKPNGMSSTFVSSIPKQTPLSVVQLLGRAGRVGTQVGTLCNLIYSQQGEVGVRRVLGVLALAKKHGTAAVDQACPAALEIGVHEYHLVRRYFERCPQAPLSLCRVDPLIRELVHFRDLIQTKTKEQSE